MHDSFLFVVINHQLINRRLVISDNFKMERKSPNQTSSVFFNSKITEAILEEITDHFIIRTYFLIKLWNLWLHRRRQVRKGHCLYNVTTLVFFRSPLYKPDDELKFQID